MIEISNLPYREEKAVPPALILLVLRLDVWPCGRIALIKAISESTLASSLKRPTTDIHAASAIDRNDPSYYRVITDAEEWQKQAVAMELLQVC